MHTFFRTGSFWLSLWIGLQQPVSLCAQAVPEPPRPRMNIAVVEGEGAMNNIREKKPVNIVVIVRDGNRRPVQGASVAFTLPAEGPGATLPNGAKTITVQSDKDGYASVNGIRPNTVSGPYRIEVEAKHNEETAAAAITQFNTSVESRGGSGKWIVLTAILGAAAAGGVVAVTRKSGNSPASAAPAPIGITPGSGVVGAPR